MQKNKFGVWKDSHFQCTDIILDQGPPAKIGPPQCSIWQDFSSKYVLAPFSFHFGERKYLSTPVLEHKVYWLIENILPLLHVFSDASILKNHIWRVIGKKGISVIPRKSSFSRALLFSNKVLIHVWSVLHSLTDTCHKHCLVLQSDLEICGQCGYTCHFLLLSKRPVRSFQAEMLVLLFMHLLMFWKSPLYQNPLYLS